MGFWDSTLGMRVRISEFCEDEGGSATADFVVLSSSLVALAVSTAIDAMEAVDDHADDLALCMKRQKNTLKRDDWSYTKKLEKMAKKCGRI